MNLRAAALACLLAVSALSRAGPLQAQLPGNEDRPLIERVEIRGVEGVDAGELREGLATQPSRCRSLVLQPFCWVSDGGAFVERERLDREELPRDALRIRVYLWRRGWRSATVETEVTPRGDGVAVAFDVAQGPETRLRSVEVRQTAPVLGEGELREAHLPAPGDRLNVIELDSARARLLLALGERGYADATVRDSIRLEDSVTAVAEVVLEPGRRATIAAIEIAGNEESTDATIRDALPLREGQLYRAGDLEEAQRALYLTGMFREAIVRAPSQPDSAKTVEVTVSEAPFQMVRTGVGVSTVDYVQLQAQYTRFNWMGGGRRLDVTGTLGRLLAGPLEGIFPFEQVRSNPLPGASDDAFLRPTWQASAQVTQPAFPAAGSSLGFGIFGHRRVEPGVVVDRGYGASATFTRDLGDNAPLSLLYRYELNTVLAGDVYFCVSYGVCDRPTISALQERQSLSPLAIGGFVDRVDDALLRNSGYTVRLGIEHASAATLSDFRYNRADAEVTRDLPVAGGTFAARVRAGWVGAAGGGPLETADGSRLHPTKRFYAGGARSARGFGENQLGPRILTIGPDELLTSSDPDTPPPCVVAEIAARTCDPNGVSSSAFTPRPIGGTKVIEGGLEYRRPVWGPFSAAVFVDAARVDDPALGSLGEARSAVTPGFGVRYRSPIGPVRVDLGFRPASTEELTVITELNENGVNRLIRLSIPKRFDPSEGSSGFLAGLTSRLTLHLSIGEAF